MRIGIFGGAFDPPHRGHEKAALAFLEKAQLDLLYVIPSGKPPHKVISDGASDEDRLEMSRRAFLPLSERIRICDREILDRGTCYSFLTVERIRVEHPNDEIFLFVGTDQFLVFETWRRFEYILELCTLCVMDRFEDFSRLSEKKAWLEENFQARVLLLSEKPYIISSTDIRRELGEWGFSQSVSPAVNEWICERGIYSSCSDPVRAGLLKKAAARLSPQRFFHTLSVERETVRLCKLLELSSADTKEMALAALYHDLAKSLSDEEACRFLEEHGEEVTEEDRAVPAVFHGRVAALMAKEEGLLSEEALLSVRYHTTGRRGMTLKEKILYFADFTEETRKHEACQKIRAEFYGALPAKAGERLDYFNRFVLRVMEHTVNYLKEQNSPCHSLGILATEHLKQSIKTERNSMTALEKAKKIASILDEKKGREVRILKVREETVITDYFVIATATSSTHLKALCDEVEYKFKEEDGIAASRVEGYQGGGWILVDFDDVIVHIFDANSRDFFNLEKLWSAAEKIDFEAKED